MKKNYPKTTHQLDIYLSLFPNFHKSKNQTDLMATTETLSTSIDHKINKNTINLSKIVPANRASRASQFSVKKIRPVVYCVQLTLLFAKTTHDAQLHTSWLFFFYQVLSLIFTKRIFPFKSVALLLFRFVCLLWTILFIFSVYVKLLLYFTFVGYLPILMLSRNVLITN